MPDKRAHRGPHGDDRRLFAVERLPELRSAVDDLSWLLGREYAVDSALKLVGDRYRLTKRQRLAVARCSCADAARRAREARRLSSTELRGRPLDIDGFNVLVTVEAALSGGLLLVGRDGCCRDLASVHGTYRKVEETRAALALIGETAAELGAADCRWLLDSPVSNSGRLKTTLLAIAADHGWSWQAELLTNPDRALAESSRVVATADSVVLDRCGKWFNLARHVVERRVPQAWTVKI